MMNERMYELINQCFIGTTDGKLSELNTVANVEKFAELIVQECADVGSKFSLAHPEAIRGQIKKHFGVDKD